MTTRQVSSLESVAYMQHALLQPCVIVAMLSSDEKGTMRKAVAVPFLHVEAKAS